MCVFKKSIVLVIPVVVLSGCGAPSSTVVDTGVDQSNKSVYQIDVTDVGNIDQVPFLKKTGKLVGKSDVTVTSQTSGRIRSISFGEGDDPAKGAVVITLDDSSNLYNYSAQRAKESVDSAKLNYTSTKVNLDNSLIDLELNLKRAQEQYDMAVRDGQKQKADLEQQLKDIEQQRMLAEYSSKTNDAAFASGSASLSLQKFDSDIQRAEFDYQTKLDADQQTLEGFVKSAQDIQNSVLVLYGNIVNDLDIILGLSDLNRDANDAYERYLGARNTQTRRVAEDGVYTLLRYEKQLQRLPFSIGDIQGVSTSLELLQTSLDQLEVGLNAVEMMLENTIDGTDLPQTQLDGLKAQINAYQSQVVGQGSSITQQINSIESFLATYEQAQKSLAKNIEILKQQRDVTAQQLRDVSVNTNVGASRTQIGAERTRIGIERSLLNIQNTITNAELSLESARNAVTANQKTRETSLAGIQNSIDQARLSYNEALANASKLTVTAPISGSIGEIFVDVGEEVIPGTRLFTLTTTGQQEVAVFLSSGEVDQVSEGDVVKVDIRERSLGGRIESISDIADAQFLYKTTILLDDLSDKIGEVVKVEVPLKPTYPLLPLEVITMKTTKQGTIWVWNGQLPEQVDVELGEVWGSNIEIVSPLGEDLKVITSSMRGYDADEFEIQVRRK